MHALTPSTKKDLSRPALLMEWSSQAYYTHVKEKIILCHCWAEKSQDNFAWKATGGFTENMWNLDLGDYELSFILANEYWHFILLSSSPSPPLSSHSSLSHLWSSCLYLRGIRITEMYLLAWFDSSWCVLRRCSTFPYLFYLRSTHTHLVPWGDAK